MYRRLLVVTEPGTVPADKVGTNRQKQRQKRTKKKKENGRELTYGGTGQLSLNSPHLIETRGKRKEKKKEVFATA